MKTLNHTPPVDKIHIPPESPTTNTSKKSYADASKDGEVSFTDSSSPPRHQSKHHFPIFTQRTSNVTPKYTPQPPKPQASKRSATDNSFPKGPKTDTEKGCRNKIYIKVRTTSKALKEARAADTDNSPPSDGDDDFSWSIIAQAFAHACHAVDNWATYDVVSAEEVSVLSDKQDGIS